MKIVRRIGVSPQQRGSVSEQSCPDVFELSDGNFAVIGTEAELDRDGNFAVMGTEATAELDKELLPDAARADYERIVIVSRETLVRAKLDIRYGKTVRDQVLRGVAYAVGSGAVNLIAVWIESRF